jgi:hypothetical protein
MMEWIKRVVWSKIWVYVLAIVVTLSSIGLLVCLEMRGPNVKAADIVEYPLERPAVQFPLALRISTDFSPKQYDALMRGAIAWSTASHNLASFELDQGWQPPEPFNPYVYEFYPEYTVWLKSTTDPAVASLVIRHGFFDGASKGKMIVILHDGTLTNEKLALVFAHELGHTLGLEHLRQPYVGLMSPGGGDWMISQLDMVEFCALYKCSDWRVGR